MTALVLKRVGLRNFQLYPARAVKYAGRPVRIWSAEHGAYWRPGGAGYVLDRAGAGRWLFQDALLDVHSCDPSKRIFFEFIEEGDTGEQARPESAWREGDGHVLWWAFPVREPPYVGSPLAVEWPGYHTHWTPLPPIPHRPKGRKVAA